MKTRILLVLAFLTPLAGWAVDPVPMDVKLGLWETTMTNQTDISSMVPPEVLSKLTPAQRAQMEAAMGGRGGPRTSTTKHCITKDTTIEALASAGRGNTKDVSCTRTFVTSTSTKMVIHMECTSGSNKTSGDVQTEVIDRENTKGSMVMNTGGASGRGGNMKMEWTSKWLGADCGDVGQKKN
ncbi:MAG: DUF3617 domain-containing protein [Bryobacteraceae bacterium]|jgi:hypothetical protein